MAIVQNQVLDKRIPFGTNASLYTVGGRQRVRDSVSTPNYASVSYKPHLPENPYQDTQHVTTGSFGKQAQTTTAEWIEYVGTYPNIVAVRRVSTSVFLQGRGYSSFNQVRDDLSSYLTATLAKLPAESVLRNEALTKILSDISDAKTNLPVLAAEASKTSALILGTANKVYRAMRAVRRGRFGEAAAILDITPKKSHNSWLSYKYGWLPLLSDVKNSAEFFAQQQYGRQPEFDLKRKATAKAQVSTSKSNDYGWTGGGRASTSTLTGVTRTYTIKARVRLDNPHLATAQQLGLTNPLLVAWELVPYSFVFDWFIGVGDYLQAISALHGVTIVKAMYSGLDVRTSEQAVGERGYVSGNTTYSSFSTYYKLESRLYGRGPTTISALDVAPVRNRDPWSFQKVITSLALLKGQANRTLRI